jgi:hypothetical protein
MHWTKHGRLVAEGPSAEWARSHLMVPIVVPGATGRVQLYFSARDEHGRAHIGRGELAFPGGPVVFEGGPLLAPGELGAFDDSGVIGSCLVRDGDRVLLYYIGWRRGVSVPFYTRIGCAVSEDAGLSFRRVSRGPIIPSDDVDPLFTTSPWVIREEGRWRMWYASCVRWEQRADGPRHVYHVRYAESEDGLSWRRDGHACIDFAAPEEYAIARPCVVRDGDLYRMWYSVRGHRYRIGYAESEDGILWERRDDVLGLEPSPSGWDSEMVEYPFVLDRDGTRYLLYNGNGYGATGIGLASLVEDT